MKNSIFIVFTQAFKTSLILFNFSLVIEVLQFFTLNAIFFQTWFKILHFFIPWIIVIVTAYFLFNLKNENVLIKYLFSFFSVSLNTIFMLLLFLFLHNYIDKTYRNRIARKHIEVIHDAMDQYQAKHKLIIRNNPNNDKLVEENLINIFTPKRLLKSTFFELVFNLIVAFFFSLLIFTTSNKDKNYAFV